jgi:hypothetical protein
LWLLAPADQLESNAAKQWDIFYRRNTDKFFKDRHYFDREFPPLLQPNSVFLEVSTSWHVPLLTPGHRDSMS